MDASRPADPAEMAVMHAAAQTYMGAVIGMARRIYGPSFDDWPDDGKHACAIGMAVQAILTPEAFAAPTLNLNVAAHALGTALGTQSASLEDAQTHTILMWFSVAFATGRTQAHLATFGMKTEGAA